MAHFKYVLYSLLLAAIVACGPAEESSASDTYMLTIGDDRGGFRVTLPDGRSFTDPNAYAMAFPNIVADSGGDGSDIAFRFHERIANDVDRSIRVHVSGDGDVDVRVRAGTGDANVIVRNKSAIGQLEQPLQIARWYLPGDYVFTANVDAGKRINGCISAWASPTATARLHRSRTQLWDMHAGMYPRDGRTCFGLYESESHWTRCTCLPTYGEMANAVASSLAAVGIAAGTAHIIAQAVTPVLMVGVAISPIP